LGPFIRGFWLNAAAMMAVLGDFNVEESSRTWRQFADGYIGDDVGCMSYPGFAD